MTHVDLIEKLLQYVNAFILEREGEESRRLTQVLQVRSVGAQVGKELNYERLHGLRSGFSNSRAFDGTNPEFGYVRKTKMESHTTRGSQHSRTDVYEMHRK